ncbi:MAG: hypothetical protein LBU22_03375 [Dysgonamonadaceae bacterium]|jgi:polygalacturonase|nr:hypothetical protein [Dysgonamonadaceae bacterium]
MTYFPIKKNILYKTVIVAYMLVLLLLYAINGFSQTMGVWDVYSFGAKGDGKIPDTQAIQMAIDDCYRAGGGKVLLHNGQFLSGTIHLKSQVTLHVASGATLLGSNSPVDYPLTSTQYMSTSGDYLIDRTLIFAEGAENIAITGNGIINGNGDELDTMEKPRPHIIHFRYCKHVKVRNIHLYNAAFWVQKYQSCENLLIDGITVDSRENKNIEQARFIDVPGGRNTDGCNIVDCRNVRIANCTINSGDDGIVLKSFAQPEGCYNITVTNCVISTNASGIKIGTESTGEFKDICINNCTVYNTRGAAIGLMTVDGAAMERIIVSNITLLNIKGAALFLRIGNRGKIYRKADKKPGLGTMKNILIQNIYGSEIERYGCSITGINNSPLENISIRNVCLTFKGGDKPLFFEGYEGRIVEELTVDNVPEMEDSYPRSEMFGKLPAYGFYVRHVNGIEFNNIKLQCKEEDKRPALVTDDVQNLFIVDFQADTTSRCKTF